MSYAVITGASSGIGKSFAFLLASKGHDLVLIARRGEVLQNIAKVLRDRYGTESIIIKADLSRTGEVKRCIEEIKDLNIRIFINNAGLGEAGSFLETDLEKELFMVDVNIKAVHIFTKYMAKYFTDRGGGYLLNVASSAGLLPAGPFMAAYYATKAYVVSLTKAVAEELGQQGSGAYVGCLCPGPVDTEFNEVANVKFALPGITAKRCVTYAYREMLKGKKVIIPSALLRLGVAGRRIAPDGLLLKVIASQQKKKLSL